MSTWWSLHRRYRTLPLLQEYASHVLLPAPIALVWGGHVTKQNSHRALEERSRGVPILWKIGTGDFGAFWNWQGNFKNSDRGHCLFLKSTVDTGGQPIKGPLGLWWVREWGSDGCFTPYRPVSSTVKTSLDVYNLIREHVWTCICEMERVAYSGQQGIKTSDEFCCTLTLGEPNTNLESNPKDHLLSAGFPPIVAFYDQ